MYRVTILFLCLFALAAFPVDAFAVASAPAPNQKARQKQAADKELPIPFVYNPPDIPGIVVRVSIDGHPPLPFLVDTGWTGALTIDSSAAKDLALKPDAEGNHNSALEYTLDKVKSVVLEGASPGANLTMQMDEATVADLSNLLGDYIGVHLAGIIGIPVLSALPCRFDFATKRITFLLNGVHEAPRDAVVLPLRPDPLISGPVEAPVAITPRETAYFMVDTGSTGTVASLNDIGGITPLAATSAGYTTVAGTYLTPQYLLGQVRLGGFDVRDVTIGFIPPQELTRLGVDVLSLFRFTLDVPDKRLILERPAGSPSTPLASGWVGVDPRAQGQDWFVDKVDAGSPGARAGLRPGDEIVSVDGHTCHGLPFGAMSRLVPGVARTVAHFEIERAGARRTLSFMRGNQFSAPKKMIDGIAMFMPSGKPFIVLNVAPGCPAAKAGLLAQDKVKTIDGISTSTITFAQLAQAFDQAEIDFIVTRAGGERTIRVGATKRPNGLKPVANLRNHLW